MYAYVYVYTFIHPSIYPYYCNDLHATYSLTIQTQASHKWKVQESSSFSVQQGWGSQLVFCICWNTEEVGSDDSEEMDVLAW